MITRTIVAFALCLAAADASAARKEFSASRSETLSAKVKKVDQKTRMVTLVGEDGSEESFKAGEEVRNLKQVKKGDVVTVMVDQSLSLWLLAKDEVAPELAGGSDVYRAKPGEKPGGLIAADVSGVATVEAIAADKTKVTLKGPKGNLLDLAVRNPANLDGVAVGDRVGFAYTETVAISVEPGKKKK
jgi:Cu/Ag efflux protein CusF